MTKYPIFSYITYILTNYRQLLLYISYQKIICACCHFKVFSCTNYNRYAISCCHKSLPWQTGWKSEQKIILLSCTRLVFFHPNNIWLSKTNEGWELLFGKKIMTRNLKLGYLVKLNLLPANWMFTDTTNLLAP